MYLPASQLAAGTQPGHDRWLSYIQLTQVKGLIADGSDINAKERSGQEALHYAAMMGSAETTTLLIEAGAVRYQGIRHTVCARLSASVTLLLPAEC